MNTIKAAICDDNLNETEVLQQKLIAWAKEKNIELFIKSFVCAEDFLSVYQKNSFDIIFMDIYMTGMNGVDAVRRIREKDTNVYIVFATTSTEHALDGYRLHVQRYLEKPYANNEIISAIEDALLKKRARKPEPVIFFKVQGKELMVEINHIVCIEQQSKLLHIYLDDGSIIEATGRIDHLTELLSAPLYIHCHKSYLVNISFVESYDRDLSVFYLHGGITAHIRREALSASIRSYEDFLFKKVRENV